MSKYYSPQYKHCRFDRTCQESAPGVELVASLYFPGTGDGWSDHPPDGDLVDCDGVVSAKWFPGGFLELSSFDHFALLTFLERVEHSFNLHTR